MLSDKPKARLELGDITKHNLKQLKVLNRVVFPVSYNDRFYQDILTSSTQAQANGEIGHCKLAYYNDIPVGAVCCRIEPAKKAARKRCYIMTLGCLNAYRRLGVGKTMLDHVERICQLDQNIESIYLHVQSNNEAAISFYERFGFVKVGAKEGYYKRIEPAGAYVLAKRLRDDAEYDDLLTPTNNEQNGEQEHGESDIATDTTANKTETVAGC